MAITTGLRPSSTFTGDKASFVWLACGFSVVTEDLEGCTPGYWKNTRMHYCEWDATPYGPDDDFDATFGTNYFNPDRTLLEALNAGGGGYDALGRHGERFGQRGAHPCLRQQVGRTRSHGVGLAVGENRGIDEIKLAQSHRLHRPGGRTDIPRMAGARQHDVNVGEKFRIGWGHQVK